MNARREAIRNYKERKIPKGIFVVRFETNGRQWVDSSPNLGAARNAVWSQLKSGAHYNKDLQAQWNAHGEAAFEFEVVEELDPETPEIAVRDELKRKRKEWVAKLGVTTVSP